ncbi:hypothetical protein HYW36_02950 [Candidatus Saccharibacteria bacterium]|nr:hypothetical protein [Candidatus Saccharibacteria bacterium]
MKTIELISPPLQPLESDNQIVDLQPEAIQSFIEYIQARDLTVVSVRYVPGFNSRQDLSVTSLVRRGEMDPVVLQAMGALAGPIIRADAQGNLVQLPGVAFYARSNGPMNNEEFQTSFLHHPTSDNEITQLIPTELQDFELARRRLGYRMIAGCDMFNGRLIPNLNFSVKSLIRQMGKSPEVAAREGLWAGPLVAQLDGGHRISQREGLGLYARTKDNNRR